jgi:hypothetical protein
MSRTAPSRAIPAMPIDAAWKVMIPSTSTLPVIRRYDTVSRFVARSR